MKSCNCSKLINLTSLGVRRKYLVTYLHFHYLHNSYSVFKIIKLFLSAMTPEWHCIRKVLHEGIRKIYRFTQNVHVTNSLTFESTTIMSLSCLTLSKQKSWKANCKRSMPLNLKKNLKIGFEKVLQQLRQLSNYLVLEVSFV